MSHQGSVSGFYMPLAVDAHQSDRAVFLRKTYTTLGAAVAAFMMFSALLLESGFSAMAAQFVLSIGQVGWLGVLVCFIAVSSLTDQMAHGQTPGIQLAGLILYVVAEGLIFAPLIYLAYTFSPGAITTAAMWTMLIFGSLTVYALSTKQDFAFLRAFLNISAIAAIGLIVMSAFMGFSLGNMFSFAMILLAAGLILYNTSKIINEYQIDQHVGAAAALFASVALMFWYVLQIFMSQD